MPYYMTLHYITLQELVHAGCVLLLQCNRQSLKQKAHISCITSQIREPAAQIIQEFQSIYYYYYFIIILLLSLLFLFYFLFFVIQ